MDDVDRVHEFKRGDHLGCVKPNQLGRQRPEVLYQVLQGSERTVFKEEVEALVVLERTVELHNIAMLG